MYSSTSSPVLCSSQKAVSLYSEKMSSVTSWEVCRMQTLRMGREKSFHSFHAWQQRTRIFWIPFIFLKLPYKLFPGLNCCKENKLGLLVGITFLLNVCVCVYIYIIYYIYNYYIYYILYIIFVYKIIYIIYKTILSGLSSCFNLLFATLLLSFTWLIFR